MVKLDKIKIIAPTTAIRGYEGNPLFEVTTRGNEIIRYKYTNSLPSVWIIVTPSESKVSVEFTGKILGERYPELINKETIGVCFDNINQIFKNINQKDKNVNQEDKNVNQEEVVFQLDKDVFINKGVVGQCDVTADLLDVDTKGLSEFINHNINTPNWVVENYKGGLVARKTVKTANSQRRYTVYDKEAEMDKQENRDFISKCKNGQSILDYFKGRTRFELNLTTMRAIRRALKIENVSVLSILNAECNPIRDAILSSVKLTEKERAVKNVRDKERCAFLERYNYDFSLIRQEIAPFYKCKNSINKTLSVYRELARSINPMDYSWVNDLLDQAA